MPLPLGVPVDVLCAFEKDIHRKPRPGLWHHLVSHRFPSIEENCQQLISHSMYIGDGAGRKAVAGRKKDFSASDLKFALNVGLEVSNVVCP